MRALVALVTALLVVACSSAPGGGGGGGQIPAGGTVWFGTSYDPTSLGVVGRALAPVKQGSPIVAVARLHTARNPAEVKLMVSSGSTTHNNVTIAAKNGTESADIYAADLTGLGLTATTWQVNFTDPQSRIIASGFIQIIP
jgi:hypothetical protein